MIHGTDWPWDAVDFFAFLGGGFEDSDWQSKVKVTGAKIEDADAVLCDLKTYPKQTTPIDKPEVGARRIREMLTIMARNEAPPEAYTRLSFKVP